MKKGCQMRLSIKNIGKMKEANIEINGITVIGGKNNTGKSTIGKALYSIFNSFYEIEEQINKERILSIERILGISITGQSETKSIREYATEIFEQKDLYINDPKSLKESIEHMFDSNFKSYRWISLDKRSIDDVA